MSRYVLKMSPQSSPLPRVTKRKIVFGRGDGQPNRSHGIKIYITIWKVQSNIKARIIKFLNIN